MTLYHHFNVTFLMRQTSQIQAVGEAQPEDGRKKKDQRPLPPGELMRVAEQRDKSSQSRDGKEELRIDGHGI